MKFFRHSLYLWLALSTAAFCQVVEPQPATPNPAVTQVQELPDDGIRVAVLGYHDFSETEPETAMRIRTSKFREQLETIRELGLAVIPMSDFIAWKNGEKTIPAKSVVITIDDGWKSVYTDAYPILKEFGYPYTIYLYKDYIDGGGKALTTAMVKELIKNGATIGSHSTSHPYPQTVKKHIKRGAKEYDQFLDIEMRDSKRYLEQQFKKNVTTYAYPGGFFTDEMLIKAEQVGYSHLFTVQPGKVNRNLPNNILPRYIILGNYDKIFEFATNFRDSAADAAGTVVEGLAKTLEFPVNPQPGAIVNSRLPNIEVDLTNATNIDPKTLKMQVGGFGEVPANYASAGKLFSWQVNRRLRNKTCTVVVTWKDLEGKPASKPLEWTFQIDRGAAYLPNE
ncbi:MAG: polysaccharide deacetylase family protein [Verrucomicrobiota bacterium]